MRIVAIEEHFTCQDLLIRIDCWAAPGTTMYQALKSPALADMGTDKIAAMNTASI
jgi:hypothetical protein